MSEKGIDGMFSCIPLCPVMSWLVYMLSGKCFCSRIYAGLAVIGIDVFCWSHWKKLKCKAISTFQKSLYQFICCIHVVTVNVFQFWFGSEQYSWYLILPVTGGQRVILKWSTTMETLNLKDLVSVNFVGQKHFSFIIFRQSEIQRGLTFLDLKGGLKPKFLRHPVYQSVK